VFVIVVGGGKVGYFLARELIGSGHEVALMERDRVRAAEITEQIGSIVIAHDGCEGKYLGEAGANRADIVTAVTGDDEDNLVICQMAKHHFNVPRTIARVNNPQNEGLFKHPRLHRGRHPGPRAAHPGRSGRRRTGACRSSAARGFARDRPAGGEPRAAGWLLCLRRHSRGASDLRPLRHRAARGRQGDRHRPLRMRGRAAQDPSRRGEGNR
jgi:hypothetical protein